MTVYNIEDISDLTYVMIALRDNYPQIDGSKSLTSLFDEVKNTEKLHLNTLLHNSNWPYAVDPDSICSDDNEDDKFHRASNIIKGLYFNFKDKNVLDYGCGEGHMAESIYNLGAANVLGYDISVGWQNRGQFQNLTFTDNLDGINIKFDIIILYDVLDHVSDCVSVLKRCKSFLADKGQIYVMCHPWCSRHGSHLYKQINKAYVHLIFNDSELSEMGYKQQYVRKSIHPLSDYYDFFKKSNLKKSYENIIRESMPDFFKHPLLVNRIYRNWKRSSDLEVRNRRKFPVFQLEQQFCEFILT